MKEHETKIKVRYVETDRMGIVHHSNYFAWFEVGRTEFIKEQGMRYKDMENAGVLLPLIECGCEFKAGAKYEDELVIKTSINSLSPVKVEFKYEVLREHDRNFLANGFTRHAFVNKEFKPINLQKKYPEVWSIMNK